jgi:predicted Zn-dependent protease
MYPRLIVIFNQFIQLLHIMTKKRLKFSALALSVAASLSLLLSCDSTIENTQSSDEKSFGNQIDQALDEGSKLIDGFKKNVDAFEINGFSIDDDKKMGKELYDEILSSGEYKVLDRASNAKLYGYIEEIKQRILNSGKLKHKDDFEWKLTIIDDEETINAFCAPGGYIFVYTGIIHFLDNEAELAGVMAHEIGHADRRHGTRQLTKSIGIDIVLSYLFGNGNGAIARQITSGLLNLRYSRKYEREADKCSVKYLCSTEYNAAGGAGFFEKILETKGDQSLELLSTHPDPKERIENFNAEKEACNCDGNNSFEQRYQKIKKSL